MLRIIPETGAHNGCMYIKRSNYGKENRHILDELLKNKELRWQNLLAGSGAERKDTGTAQEIYIG